MTEAENKFQELNDDELDGVNGGVFRIEQTSIRCLKCNAYTIVKPMEAFPTECSHCGSDALSIIE